QTPRLTIDVVLLFSFLTPTRRVIPNPVKRVRDRLRWCLGRVQYEGGQTITILLDAPCHYSVLREETVWVPLHVQFSRAGVEQSRSFALRAQSLFPLCGTAAEGVTVFLLPHFLKDPGCSSESSKARFALIWIRRIFPHYANPVIGELRM